MIDSSTLRKREANRQMTRTDSATRALPPFLVGGRGREKRKRGRRRRRVGDAMRERGDRNDAIKSIRARASTRDLRVYESRVRSIVDLVISAFDDYGVALRFGFLFDFGFLRFNARLRLTIRPRKVCFAFQASVRASRQEVLG